MGTSLTDIVDLFLSNIDDYKLTSIYTTSGSNALNTFCEPWLLNSIVDFRCCDQSLTYTPITGSADGSFSLDLSQENKILLSQIMVLYWLERNLQDIRQMNNFIQDHDFKSWSPANTIKSKQDYINVKKEEISQRLNDYAYAKNSWSSWRSQIFWS